MSALANLLFSSAKKLRADEVSGDAKMKLGKRELSIISHLRLDGRMTLKSLGRMAKIPISTAFERLRQFRKTNLIKPTVLVDFARIGFASRILVAVKADREIREELENYLAIHLNVNSIWHVSNGFTLIFEALFRDMKGAEDFIEDLDDRFRLHKKMLFYVLGEVKREAFFSNPKAAEAIVMGKDESQ